MGLTVASARALSEHANVADITAEYVAGIWDTLDINGDGVLDRGEFQTFVQTLGRRAAAHNAQVNANVASIAPPEADPPEADPPEAEPQVSTVASPREQQMTKAELRVDVHSSP